MVRTSRAGLRDVGLLVLAALTLFGAVYVLIDDGNGPGPAAIARADDEAGARYDRRRAEEDRLAARPVAAFLGDSFTGGSAMGGNGPDGWASIVSARLQWASQLFAVGGSGFITGGQEDETFRQRVSKVVAASPDVVVVEGGQNDLGVSSNEAVAAAANEVLRDVRSGLPQARLVLIAPLVSGDPSELALDLRDRLRAVAEDNDATYVDPVEQRWLSGPQKRFIGRDGIHPTDEGHAFWATLAEPSLRALDVPRRPTT